MNRQHLEELRKKHERRLQILELKETTFGISTPPEILIEIEDIRKKISAIDKELIANGTYTLKTTDEVKASAAEVVNSPSLESVSSHHSIQQKSNPWISGSFYVLAFVVVMTVLAVISSSLPWYSVGIVFIGGLLAFSIISALQLRDDKNLSEENFIKLMLEALKQLPSLLKFPKDNGES